MSRTHHAALTGGLFAILCAISMLQVGAATEMFDSAGVEDGDLASGPELQTSARSGQDLVIDYISATWSSADAGDTKSVSVRLKNQGTGSSGSFYWGIYLSTDTSITTSDIELERYYKSSMSAGSTSSTYYKSVDIPLTITGARYYVGALADITGSSSETDETNNDDYDSGRVTIYAAPDLTGRSCSAPSTGVVGDYLDSSISISIENDPGGSYIDSSGSFYWAMYLSSDSTITSSDTQVGSDQSKSSISGGSYSSDSLSTSNRIPSSINPGTYYWGYLLDVRTDVDEQDENNNDYTCSGTITIQDDLPDLVADDVDTSSSSAVMGDTITVSYRIDNDGTDYSGSFHWELYLSTDRTITTSDVLVDEFSVSSISPGSYRSGYQYSVQIPVGISSGYYYLGMIADSRSSVTELDETNNVIESTSRIDIEEPADLVPQTASGPTSAYTGQQVSLSWRIDNDGDDTAGWFYWEAYLSTDMTITSNDIQVGSTQQASSISGGSYRSGSVALNIPSSLSAGTYYWGIIADSSDRVAEGDETNNILRGNSISISVAEPDLEATSISIDSGYSTVCTEDTIWVTLTATNRGNVNADAHYYEVLVSPTANNVATGTSLGFANGQSNVASYTHSVSAALPASITAGTYYVVLNVDYGNYISETDENNNVISTPTNGRLTVQDCTPDLIPTALNGPASGLRGSTAQVSSTIENFGIDAASNVAIDFFLSRDTSITMNDVYVGSDTISSIAGNSASIGTNALTIPSNLDSGCWYWGIITDMNNNIVESDESNNALADTQQFCLEQADLQVYSIGAPSGPFTTGQTVSVVIEIQNTGGDSGGAFDCTLLLSLDQQASASDTQIDTFRINSLAAGESWEVTRTVQIPRNHVGTYYWAVAVDVQSEISEDDETNNEGAGSAFEITSPTVDLMGLYISGPSSAEPGQTVSVQWAAENMGSDTLGFYVQFWLSEDDDLDGEDVLMSTQRIPFLDGGETTTQTRTFYVGENETGMWHFLLFIDSDLEHDEDVESNNIVASNSTILVGTSGPDPIEEVMGGCDSPNTDGDFGADAAATRSSAAHLGVDPNEMVVEGCLEESDLIDWYAFVLTAGNRTTIAISSAGADLSIELLNGTQMVDSGTLDYDVRIVTLAILNDGATNTSSIQHIRIHRSNDSLGGSYILRFVTANASDATDLSPPPVVDVEPLDGWTMADEITVFWSEVFDYGPAGISHYETRWGGGLWASVEGTNSTTLNISMLADGRHSLEFRAVDNSGNTGPASAIWVRIDRTAPSLSVTQIDAQYAGPPVLQIEALVDDGGGSGINTLEWSADNITWFDMPDNGAIIWSNWSEQTLYVRLTDSVGHIVLDEMEVNIPESPYTDDGAGEGTAASGGESTAMQTAIMVLLTLGLLAMAGAGVFLAVRASNIEEDEYEDDDEQDESEQESQPLPLSEAESEAEQEVDSEAFRSDHTALPLGGRYETEMGTTWYIAPDGSKWWMRKDGTFHRQDDSQG